MALSLKMNPPPYEATRGEEDAPLVRRCPPAQAPHPVLMVGRCLIARRHCAVVL